MISVVIPFHNRFDCVNRAVFSILNQSYKDFEIILVDDLSKESYTPPQSQQIKLIRNVTNLGPGGSRNVGMNHAKGEFIAFLDSDDYWHPDFLSKTLEKLSKNPEAVFAYSLTREVSLEQEKGLRRGLNQGFDAILKNIFIIGRPWCTSSCLWNNKLLGNTRWDKLKTWEDYLFDVRAALISDKVVCVEEALTYYDIGADDKLSHAVSANKLIAIRAISNLLIHSKYNQNKLIRKAFLIKYISSVVDFCDDQNVNYIKEDLAIIRQWFKSPVTRLFLKSILHTNKSEKLKKRLRQLRNRLDTSVN